MKKLTMKKQIKKNNDNLRKIVKNDFNKTSYLPSKTISSSEKERIIQSHFQINQEIYNKQSDSIATGTNVNIFFDNNRQSNLFINAPSYSELIKDAKEFLKNVPNKAQAFQAQSVLNIIEDILSGYNNLNLPIFHISTSSDGSIGMTWNILDATLGITIDMNPNDSSWFLLMGKQDDTIRAFGNLSKIDNRILFDSLINLLRRIQSKHSR